MMGYAERKVEEGMAEQRFLATGADTASRRWGLEAGVRWSGLMVRERRSDPFSADAPAPGSSERRSCALPATHPSLDNLSDLADLPADDAIDELGDRIIRFSAHMSAAEYRLLVMIGEFDRREGWRLAGHKDCAAWLELNTGLSRITARERVRVARALQELPEISKAMSRGELSFSKVRGLVRVATPENERELLPLAKECTARQLERELQRWEELERWGEEKAEKRRHRRRHLSVRPGGGGMYEIRGLVSPDVGALLMRVIDAAGDALFQKDWEWKAEGGRWGPAVEEVDPRQRRADALHLILERAMAAGFGLEAEAGDSPESMEGRGEAEGAVTAEDTESVKGEDSVDNAKSAESEGGLDDSPASVDDSSASCACIPSSPSAERYLVLFNVDQSMLEGETGGRAELDGEVTVPLETARRLTCDSAVVRIVRGAKSEVLDVGRKSRVIPPAIRRALWARDGGCRFPGCRSRYAEGHHVTHWVLGGSTSLNNLVLLCRNHHRMVHEGDFAVKMSRDGQPFFLDRNGCRIPDRAPPMSVPASVAPDPVRALVETHRFRGIEPTNSVGSCRKVINPQKLSRFREGLDPSV